MKKRVSAAQLRAGMYVVEFCGSWMSHPFWRARFTLTAGDLQRIREAGVKDVWIDTSKGLDLAPEPLPAAIPATVEDQLRREQDFVASMPLELPPEPGPDPALAQAAKLCQRALPQMAGLFAQARLGKAVDPAACNELVDEIHDSVMRNPGALISVARLKRRDEYTYMHSVAVCALMLSLGRQLGLQGDVLKQAGLAGMLHDLGKAMVPLEVLNKPGRLTEDEFRLMRSHPQRGHALLVEGGGAGPHVLDVCLHHHEKVDGSGYPFGLAGDNISLLARMGAVCDVYDAVTSVRPYKDAWDPGEALRHMAKWSGHFDTRIFQTFVMTVGIYPVGALVRLQSGRLAVVVAQNPGALLTPRVRVFFSTQSQLRIEPQLVDLASRWTQDKVVACESPADWPFKDLEQLWGNPAISIGDAL